MLSKIHLGMMKRMQKIEIIVLEKTGTSNQMRWESSEEVMQSNEMADKFWGYDWWFGNFQTK